MATHADDALAALGDADDAEREPWAGSSTRNQVVLHTDERADAPPAGAGRRGTWTRRPAPPGRAVTMTYHMNRLQSLPGDTQYFVTVNPGDTVRDDRVILARDSATRCTRSSRCEPRRPPRAPGPPVHVVRGRPPRLRVPRGRLPVRVRGRRAAARRGRGGGGRMLGAAVAPPRGQGPSSPVEPDRLRARALRLLRRPRPGGARRGGPADPPHRPQPAQRRSSSGMPTTGRRPRRTSARPSSPTCASRARTRRAGGSCWSRTCGSWATCSTRPASTCAAIGQASCAWSSSRCTTRTSSGTCTRSVPSAPGRRSRPRWTRTSTCRRSSTWRGTTRCHVQDDRRTPADRDQRAQGRRPRHRHEPRAHPRPLTDRTVARLLLRHPLVTHETIALIHWHALRLWLRGDRGSARHGEARPMARTPRAVLAAAVTRRAARASALARDGLAAGRGSRVGA